MRALVNQHSYVVLVGVLWVLAGGLLLWGLRGSRAWPAAARVGLLATLTVAAAGA